MLEHSVKKHALEKYAGDRVEAAKFVKGFKAQLEKKASMEGLTNGLDRKSTRLNSSHITRSRMPSSA